MRFYALLNFQHVVLYIIPALIFIVLFGLALGYSHFYGRVSEDEKKTVYHRFPEGIEDRREPFPIVLTLVIIGTLIWALSYILGVGLLGVKI